MVKLFSTLDMAKFAFVKHLLTTSSIAFVEKGGLFNGGAAGEVPPLVYTPEIWVKDQADYERAIVIIKQVEWQVLGQSDWDCSGCGERIESQFDTCWNCGNTLAQQTASS